MEKLAHLQSVLKARDERGASAVEYGLLVAAIAAIIISLVFVLGHYVKGSFQETCDNLETELGTLSTGSCA